MVYKDLNYNKDIYFETGGTNFGFMNGANFYEKGGKYKPTITSYGKKQYLMLLMLINLC